MAEADSDFDAVSLFRILLILAQFRHASEAAFQNGLLVLYFDK